MLFYAGEVLYTQLPNLDTCKKGRTIYELAIQGDTRVHHVSTSLASYRFFFSWPSSWVDPSEGAQDSIAGSDSLETRFKRPPSCLLHGRVSWLKRFLELLSRCRGRSRETRHRCTIFIEDIFPGYLLFGQRSARFLVVENVVALPAGKFSTSPTASHLCMARSLPKRKICQQTSQSPIAPQKFPVPFCHCLQ